MLVGALFWGLSADVIGRKHAFNYSLLISSIFTIIAGASPNWIALGAFISISAFGAGGNLVLDTAVFLEYLPSKYAWLLTLMAAWWGVGQLIAGLFAWAFLPNFSCAGPESETGEPCNWDTNPGWRYVWFASGALVFAMSIARVTIIRLKETPKFLVGEGRDEQVVETLQFIAKKYNRQCSLTIETMQACGVSNAGGRRRGGHTRQGSLCHAQDGSQHILDLVQLGEQDLKFEAFVQGQRNSTDIHYSFSSVSPTLSTTSFSQSTSEPVVLSSAVSQTAKSGATTPSPT
jgi:MFS family permease